MDNLNVSHHDSTTSITPLKDTRVPNYSVHPCSCAGFYAVRSTRVSRWCLPDAFTVVRLGSGVPRLADGLGGPRRWPGGVLGATSYGSRCPHAMCVVSCAWVGGVCCLGHRVETVIVHGSHPTIHACATVDGRRARTPPSCLFGPGLWEMVRSRRLFRADKVGSLLSSVPGYFSEVGLIPSYLYGSAYPAGGCIELCSFRPSQIDRYKVVVCFVGPVSCWSLGCFAG